MQDVHLVVEIVILCAPRRTFSLLRSFFRKRPVLNTVTRYGMRGISVEKFASLGVT